MTNSKPKKTLKIFLIIFSVLIISLIFFIDFNPNKNDKSGYNVLNKKNEKIIYASPNGLGDKSGKDKTNAIEGLQRALDIIKPGEVIELTRGDYYEDALTKTHGKSEAPIIVRGPKEAVIRGTDENERIFQILHDYYILDGFTINGHEGKGDSIENYRDKLIYVFGTKAAYNGETKRGPKGVKIRNMELKNAGGECVRLRYFVTNAEIYNNKITNCGFYDFHFNENGKNGEGIYIGTSSEQWEDDKNPTDGPDKSDQNHIHHNYINTNGNECVEVKEGGERNIIEHNNCSGGLDDDAAGLTSRGDNNIFRFNTVYGNKGCGIRLGGHKEDGEKFGIDNDVYENLIYNNDYCGIKFMREKQGKICANKFTGPNGEEQKNITRGEYGEEFEKKVTSKCQ